ncbi:hypothetical protein VNO77_23261 [Canavalia gladiata]|uniref:Uncharacterized protein n=1 Tax=Canavalia gladiata TaxID=3824 RepID=A0AAN9L447_CANGL
MWLLDRIPLVKSLNFLPPPYITHGLSLFQRWGSFKKWMPEINVWFFVLLLYMLSAASSAEPVIFLLVGYQSMNRFPMCH